MRHPVCYAELCLVLSLVCLMLLPPPLGLLLVPLMLPDSTAWPL